MAPIVLSVDPAASPVPWGVLAAASYASATKNAQIDINLDTTNKSTSLAGAGPQPLSDPWAILDAIANATGLLGDNTKTAAFLALAHSLSGKPAYPDVVAALDTLDDHLAFRTFLVGHAPSLADWAVWGSIKASLAALGILKKNGHPHLSRWYSYFDSLPSTQSVYTALNDAKSPKKAAAAAKAASSTFALGLPNAVEGQVVTRFPPEPSGYLHIGHAKAAMLNQFFARMYKGKMILRFDDTNPSKERTEFEETILEDLALLEIHGDQLTHTSDYFDKLYEQAITMIQTDKAYADDTEQLQMRAERMDGIASARRNATVKENLARFAEMTKGTEEGLRWCIRAKISVDDPNKAMRDPVIYRCNILPHHRTGSKWKVYPTYDFACPLVDSLEGVTHALRTNEYRDRNPQYLWMIEALGLRKVEVWDFSRVNFIYTLLSKRKLHWFVDQGLVTGWDDPRFPTVRGIRRRGLTVEALRQYMLLQGPSQAQVTLEWDQIWALNKKVIDPIAPRYWAISKVNSVKVTVKGGPATPEVKENPLHKKNPEIGTKKTVYTSVIYVEQEDAQSFEDQEEVTLMDWGNAFIRKKTTDAKGIVTSIEAELFLEGDFKKTKKKITWLPDITSTTYPLSHVTLLDYDYLITKKKLEDTDNVADFVTPKTEFRTEAFADANVLGLKKLGEIIQFERKGFFILDRIVEEKEAGAKRFEFISIPDGRAAGLASKAGPAVPAAADQKKATGAGGSAWGKNNASASSKSAGGVKANAAVPIATGGMETAKSVLAQDGSKVMLSEGTSGYEIPVTTKMYGVEPVTGGGPPPLAEGETKMYKVDPIYAAHKK